jgi:hypothetical protein
MGDAVLGMVSIQQQKALDERQVENQLRRLADAIRIKQ